MNKMQPKNNRLWFIGVLLVIGSILLFLGGPEVLSSRSFKHFWDIGHIFYFALLAVLLVRWKPVCQMSLLRQWVIVLTITLVLGVLIELMQYGTSRTPDSGDVIRDLTGSLLVLVFGSLGARLQPAGRRYSLRLMVVMLMLVQSWPLAKSLIDEAIARHQFPLLSGFETPFEIDRWQGDDRLSVESVTFAPERRVMKIGLTTDEYSGASLRYFDGDWVAARTLQISLYNPDTYPLRITCRIHDRQHTDGNEEFEDRFNRSYLLTPGWNRIEIDLGEVARSPANRRMDMRQIQEVMLFAMSLPTPRILYLDEIRLGY
jgi:VanZ family protein